MLNGDWDPNRFNYGCLDFSGQEVYYPRPIGNYTVEWKVTRTSTGTTYGSDTFTVYENDSTTYLIEY